MNAEEVYTMSVNEQAMTCIKEISEKISVNLVMTVVGI